MVGSKVSESKVFTEKELKVASMKLKGLANKEIAGELDVSEPDVSQTLARIRSKIGSVRDSVSLLSQIGVIREGPALILTEEGRRLADRRESRISHSGPTKLEVKMVSVKGGFSSVIFPAEIGSLQTYETFTIQSSLQKRDVERKTYKEMPITKRWS